MVKTRLLPAGEIESISAALEILKSGGLVAFPTDTVYGLGAGAFMESAIRRLFHAKGRQTSKAIPVLLGDQADLERVAVEPGEKALRLAQRFWPGPLTLVVPRHPDLPAILGPQPTIGIRMPDHADALRLLNLSGPLAVTSANRSGRENALTVQQVLEQLGGRIPIVLDGGTTPGGKPSTVVDCTGSELVILRSGPISMDDLLSALA